MRKDALESGFVNEEYLTDSKAIYRALASLPDAESIESFLRGLWTEEEQIQFVRRWAVIQRLVAAEIKGEKPNRAAIKKVVECSMYVVSKAALALRHGHGDGMLERAAKAQLSEAITTTPRGRKSGRAKRKAEDRR